MTHETFIVQIHQRRRWTNANYYDSIEGAMGRAKFYEETCNWEMRVKEKYTNKVIYQTGC